MHSGQIVVARLHTLYDVIWRHEIHDFLKKKGTLRTPQRKHPLDEIMGNTHNKQQQMTKCPGLKKAHARVLLLTMETWWKSK